MAEDTTLHTEGESTYIVTPRRLSQPGEEVHKYRLKVPTFAGIEDIEQFISEFNETWAITQWPPRVALVKLRGTLTGETKPYGQRPGIGGIFTALRDRFGTTTLDARFRLQRLLRKEDTSLQDHAIAVKRLAQIAYSDLPETQRRGYILEDLTQSINHPGLHHQLQAKGVTSIEAALWEGEAYLQAQRLYETPQQVTRLRGQAPATTISTSLSLEAATDRLITMLTWAMAALSSVWSPATPPEAPRRTNRCWNYGRQGHQRSGCPQNQQRPDSRKPRRPPRPRKPGEERMQGGFRRASERTPRHTPVSGRNPAGLVDQNGSGRTSYCPSRTASASYRKRSWLARSIRTSEGSTPPLRQRSLIFRGLGDHATNGHRPAWLRPSMLGKWGYNHTEIVTSYQGR